MQHARPFLPLCAALAQRLGSEKTVELVLGIVSVCLFALVMIFALLFLIGILTLLG